MSMFPDVLSYRLVDREHDFLQPGIALLITTFLMGYMFYRTYLISNQERARRGVFVDSVFGIADNSDKQYAGFRGNLPILLTTALIQCCISLSLMKFHTARRVFRFISSVLVLIVLFGVDFLKILIVILLPYILIKLVARSTPIISSVTGISQAALLDVARWALWLFVVAELFLVDRYSRTRIPFIFDIPGLSFLAQYNGLGMRWNVTVGFCHLRALSFISDYTWAINPPAPLAGLLKRSQSGAMRFREVSHSPVATNIGTGSMPEDNNDGQESIPLELASPQEVQHDVNDVSTAQYTGVMTNSRPEISETDVIKRRIEAPHELRDYTILNYLRYQLYFPLFLAGPIISFNDFRAQERKAVKITFYQKGVYLARLIGMIALMELMMCNFYVVALKETGNWSSFLPVEIGGIGFINLIFIWLKLTIIWRLFRCWALIDDVETFENMTRCMCDHHSGMEFWKSWHRSFNKWLVRYLYIPLGGNKHFLLNTVPTFVFVALWHDISMKLLSWGFLIIFFLAPEFLARKLFDNVKMRETLGETLFNDLECLGGSFNILAMVTANLVGFAVGIEGMKSMWDQILQPAGILFVLASLFDLFFLTKFNTAYHNGFKRLKS